MCVGKIFLRSGVSVWKKSRGEHRGGSSHVRVVSIVCFLSRRNAGLALTRRLRARSNLLNNARKPQGCCCPVCWRRERRETTQHVRRRARAGHTFARRARTRFATPVDRLRSADPSGHAGRRSRLAVPAVRLLSDGDRNKKEGGRPVVQMDASSHATGRGVYLALALCALLTRAVDATVPTWPTNAEFCSLWARSKVCETWKRWYQWQEDEGRTWDTAASECTDDLFAYGCVASQDQNLCNFVGNTTNGDTEADDLATYEDDLSDYRADFQSTYGCSQQFVRRNSVPVIHGLLLGSELLWQRWKLQAEIIGRE